ncbi:DUF3325 domain-containing protein [Caulobacter sp. RHG1]|uniref:DUF3325 domain-containing protein n=1 Tax=Caulobacter sp. (strain RHG1) TaxID=2545762 RepID=UPI0015562C74|nr:DUF3325 domain-containing protein [Caulobacter sp. RHG1]NQE61482.1 hypothetical protein [Caulobacter sp. RHG1]
MRLILSLYLSYAGALLIALSQARHHQAAFNTAATPLRIRRLRWAGATALTIAPLPWIALQGIDIGLVTWAFCGLPIAGLLAVLVLTYAPRRAAQSVLARPPKEQTHA